MWKPEFSNKTKLANYCTVIHWRVKTHFEFCGSALRCVRTVHESISGNTALVQTSKNQVHDGLRWFLVRKQKNTDVHTDVYRFGGSIRRLQLQNLQLKIYQKNSSTISQILVPIALFAPLSWQGLGTRIREYVFMGWITSAHVRDLMANLVPRATSSPGPSPRRFSKWRIVGSVALADIELKVSRSPTPSW